jgi:hypothetical protein
MLKLPSSALTRWAALDAKAESHVTGIKEGTGIGVGAVLILFALIFGIMRLKQNFTVSRKVAA